jgi:hypothetical protein
MNKQESIVLLISKVLDGVLSPEEALDIWPADEPTDTKLMKNAWHLLYHYYTDDDIRLKEPAYEARQKDALRNMIDHLRQN